MGKVSFISYINDANARCDGSLVLKIDGEIVRFGNDIDDDYDRFWESGGEAKTGSNGAIYVYKRPWIIHEEKLPDKYKQHKEEIEVVMNRNVQWGCCGRCVYG